jgi:predicted phosphodiesterase
MCFNGSQPVSEKEAVPFSVNANPRRLPAHQERRWLAALAFWALVAVASGGQAHAQEQKWKFMVFGDSRGTNASDNQINTEILAELARAITNEQPAFVLVAGDLVNSGSLSAFQVWANIMGPVYEAGIAIYPVMGNHDTPDVDSFKEVFGAGIPDNGPAEEIDRTYFIAHSNALVLALDDYVSPHRVNQPWVDSVLATNTRPHVFAFGHEPAFKACHTDCLDDYPTNRDAFWNSLSNANARVYFAGHDHFYDHIRLDDGDGNPNNDLHQMIVGTGGGPPYTYYAYDGTNGIWTPQPVFHESRYGYVIVEIAGYIATATRYHRTGPDTYVATSDVSSYSAAPVIAFSYAGGNLTLTWRGAGALEVASDVNGVYSAVPGAASPYVITNLSESPRYYRVRLP